MKKLSTVYLLPAIALLFTGCNKFLDKEPDNRTNITTAAQLSQLLTTAYPKGNYILFCESMSDNSQDRNGGGAGIDYTDRINRQAFRYEVIEATPDNEDSPDFYWNACYHAIAAANQALQIINNSPVKDQLTAQRGEALLARAYAHFMLVTFFSKAYDPVSAASDPGIPYVTAPENVVLAKYERKTVSYVYDMIEKDLKEGYPLINESIYGTAPKFHFNRQASAAFAARFYMFKRDYNSVILYASQALTGTSVADNLRPWNTVMANLQYNDLEALYTQSTLKGNLLLQEAPSLWGRSYPNLRYGLDDATFTSLFSNPNVTGWTYAYTFYYQTINFNFIPKFYENFVKESISSGIGEPYNTIPLLTAEEAVLNRAEAYTRLNNKAAAIGDLNAFISKNIADFNPATDTVTPRKIVAFYKMPADTLGAMVNTALDFKRAFFIHEGLRWLDILRLKIPVVHRTVAGETITLTADDKRRVLQLPVLTKQAGLEPNVR